MEELKMANSEKREIRHAWIPNLAKVQATAGTRPSGASVDSRVVS
jgi:hypothetical protein